MKKFVLLCASLSACMSAWAQPWLPETMDKPVRLSDIVARYRMDHPQTQAGKAENEETSEGLEYQFGRWNYYWQQHLDENGYMVSPMKTYAEWAQYLETHTGKRGTARATSADTSHWVFQGPITTMGGYAGIGRINVAAFDPVDPNVFYVGAAGGGVWKTTDGGNSWTALYNIMPTMGVSDIKVNPLNPNTIYVCTGDKDAKDNYSIGVLKSTDGGNTWTTFTLGWTISSFHLARTLLINPVDTNTLILGTDVGIYKTYNGGASWSSIATGDFEQILFDPLDTNKLYGTTLFNTSSGSNTAIVKSINGGATWVAVKSFTDADRVNIATCPSSPSLVMAVVSNTNNGLEGVYGSNDEGVTWGATFMNNASCTNNLLSWDMGLPATTCSGQGWYDLCIAIDPADHDKVIIGGVNHYYSTDGGYTWQLATQWYSSLPGVQTMHADQHWMGFNPLNGMLYATCDGGVYSTAGIEGSLWNDHTSGIACTEFYRIAVGEGVNFCLGGAQDNGTKQVGGGTSSDILGGDGMVCQIDYMAPASTWYGSYYNGTITQTFSAGGSWTTISDAIGDTLGGDWVTPYIIHPAEDNILLVGYDKLFMSADFGSSWNAISPQFASNYKINDIEVPIANPNEIYVVVDDNSIRFSPDFGATWNLLPSNGSSATISRIITDPFNADMLWVTFSGYTASRKVMCYDRIANHWINMAGTLPNIPVNCIIIDTSTGTRYIGTETTVFYRDTTMSDWALYNTDLPAVIINDLKINYGNKELWAGTYGRGIWKSGKADVPNGIAPLAESWRPQTLRIIPDPNAGIFTLQTTNRTLAGQKVPVSITDNAGRTAWAGTLAADANGNIAVSAARLVPGTYTIHTIDGASCKMQVIK
jgi:photosystem II stability/assembly factor-like uncharacterized protein